MNMSSSSPTPPSASPLSSPSLSTNSSTLAASSGALPSPYDHPQSTDPNNAAVVGGHVLSGRALRDYAKKHGLCPICAQTKTHEKQNKNILSVKLIPKEFECNSQGDVVVFKGYCIQPTCFTSIDQVQAILNQQPPQQQRSRRQKRPSNTATTRTSITAGSVPNGFSSSSAAATAAAALASSSVASANLPSHSSADIHAGLNGSFNHLSLTSNTHASASQTGNPSNNAALHCRPSPNSNSNGLDHHQQQQSRSQQQPQQQQAIPPNPMDQFNPQLSPIGLRTRTKHGAADIQSILNSRQQNSSYPQLPQESYPLVFDPRNPSRQPSSNSDNNNSTNSTNTNRSHPMFQSAPILDIPPDITPPPPLSGHQKPASLAPPRQPTATLSSSSSSGGASRELPEEFSHLQQPPQTSSNNSSNSNATGATNGPNRNTSSEMAAAAAVPPQLVRSSSPTSMDTSQTGQSSGQRSLNSMVNQEMDDPILRELREFINDHNYIGFFACLENKAVVATICPPAFTMFTKQIMKHQLSTPGTVLLVGDNWIKTIFKHMKEFYTIDPDVAISGMTIFLSLVMLPEKKHYMRAMVKRGAAVECALRLLEHYAPENAGGLTTPGTASSQYNSQVVTMCCAWMECMSSSEEDGISARTKGDVTMLIRKLAFIVVEGLDPAPKSYAVRTLAHWSSHRRKSEVGTTLGQDIKAAIKDCGSDRGRAVTALQEMAHRHSNMYSAMLADEKRGIQVANDHVADDSVLAAVLTLLWRMSVPQTEQEIGNMDRQWSSMGWLHLLLVILQNQLASSSPSFVVMESCLGLMANLTVLMQFPLELSPGYVEAVIECIQEYVLNSNPTFLSQFTAPNEITELTPSLFDAHERLGVGGVHALCNILSSKSRRDRAWRNPANRTSSMYCIMEVWQKFPEMTDMQELACLAIGYACQGKLDEAIMDDIIQLGFMEHVAKHFQAFIGVPSKGPLGEAKEATLCALLTLTRCRSGLTAIVRNDIQEKLEPLAAVETAERNRKIMRKVIAIARDNREMILSSSTSSSSLFGEHLDNSLLKTLQDYVETSSPGLVPFLGPAIKGLFQSMQNEKKNVYIQEEGTYIIACLCYQFPYERWNEPVVYDGAIVSDIFLTKPLLVILENALKQHRSRPAIQSCACSAVANLLSKLPLDESNNCQDPGLQVAISPFLKLVLDALQCHQHQHPKVDKAAIHLFWLLVLNCKPDDLRRWSVRIVQSVINSMSAFESEQDLLVLACDCILALENDKECLEAVATEEGVKVLLKMQSSQYDSIAIAAAGVLSAALRSVFTASRHIMAQSEAINHLILSMTQRGENLRAQIYICSIFESILTLEDAHVKTTIGDGGGFNVICEGLRNHGSDNVFVLHAARCLSSMIPILLPDTYEPMREPLGSSMKFAFEVHLDNEEIQCALIDVWMACCNRDQAGDGFHIRHLVEDPVGLPSIFGSMNAHPGSLEIQRNGCCLLKLLTMLPQNRATVGANGGVNVVANAMVLHKDSLAVQKEALLTIKNLAAEHSNKEMMQIVKADRVVSYILWINFGNPAILSNGFPALNNIVVDAVRRTVSELGEDVLQLVMIAMNKYPESLLVQKNACFLLKSCTYHPSNLEQMKKHRVYLSKVLRQAAELFPSQCEERANGILSKIVDYY